MTLNDLFTIGLGDIIWAVVAVLAILFFTSYSARFRYTEGDELIVSRFGGAMRFMARRIAALWKEVLSFGAVLFLALGVTDASLIASIPLLATFEPFAWGSFALASFGVLEVVGVADITFRNAGLYVFLIIAAAFLIHNLLEVLYEVYVESD